MRKFRVCGHSGTRSGFGILLPVFKAIEEHPKLELRLVVSDMHLAGQFGYTVKEVEEHFKVDVKVDMLLSNDSGAARAKSLGIGLYGMTQALESISPDFVLILGDRGEDLVMAIAALNMNIPVAHIHGGDVTQGGVDEPVRHAITKISHIHFVATKQAEERVKRLGEESWRIHIVGSPGLDSILNQKLPHKKEFSRRYNLDLTKPLIIVLQHPVTTQLELAYPQMRQTLEAIKKLALPTIIIYPNSDAGCYSTIRAIKEYEGLAFLSIYENLPHRDFLGLLSLASVLVGNSSSGIIEAPSFHLPVVNIGIRQERRLRANNVIDVDHKKEEILSAIKLVLHNRNFKEKVSKCINPYGDGRAGIRIAKFLSEMRITPKLLEKRITF